MVALVRTVAYLGLEARAVEVQCQVAAGMPRFNLVGLPDKAVGESRERVQAALAAMGLSLPPKRITINLSPAALPKEGSHYDLPIALALLAAMGVTDAEQLGDWIAVGALTVSTLLNAAYFLPIVYRAFLVAPAADDHAHHGEAPAPMVIAQSLTALGAVAIFLFPGPAIALARALAGG